MPWTYHVVCVRIRPEGVRSVFTATRRLYCEAIRAAQDERAGPWETVTLSWRPVETPAPCQLDLLP